MSQYSRPAYADEGPPQDEQLELYSGTPELSLKFALPPVAQACLPASIWHAGDSPRSC